MTAHGRPRNNPPTSRLVVPPRPPVYSLQPPFAPPRGVAMPRSLLGLLALAVAGLPTFAQAPVTADAVKAGVAKFKEERTDAEKTFTKDETGGGRRTGGKGRGGAGRRQHRAGQPAHHRRPLATAGAAEEPAGECEPRAGRGPPAARRQGERARLLARRQPAGVGVEGRHGAGVGRGQRPRVGRLPRAREREGS